MVRPLPRLTAFGACLIGAVTGARLAALTPKAEALEAWAIYVGATEVRLARQTVDAERFLAADFGPDTSLIRRAVEAGQIRVDRVAALDASGRTVDVPSATVEDWRGLVFIPGARLAALVAGLEAAVPPQDDVLRAEIVSRDADTLTVHLRVRRTKVVTVAYDTEQRVVFARLTPTRATSRTTATQIVELADPGTTRERPLGPDEDHGYLWRWNTYWRYEEVPGGVFAECESLSLSRPAPPVLGVLIGPIVNGVARDSLERTLRAVRTAYTAPPRT